MYKIHSFGVWLNESRHSHTHLQDIVKHSVCLIQSQEGSSSRFGQFFACVFQTWSSAPHTQLHAHSCLSLLAVCFTINASTPLFSVCFTHDVAHLFTHLSELLCVNVCVCRCCHARLEWCWSACQASGIWPCPGVLWHVGMQDSKMNRQELAHMAALIQTSQHCICRSSSGVLAPISPISMAP